MGEKGNAAGAAVESDEGFSLPGFAKDQADKTVDDLRGRAIEGAVGTGRAKDEKEEKDEQAGEDDSAGKI